MKYSIAASLILLISSTALAAPPTEKGWYAGGVVGVTNADDDKLFESPGVSFDDTDVSYGLFAGYKFLKYLGLEARFTQLGRYSISTTNSGSDKIKPTALSANLIGSLPLGQSSWELFGQLGVAQVLVNTDLPEVDDQTAGTAGVGIRVYPKENVAFTLQYDVYLWEEEIGNEKYDIEIGTTQVGLLFHF